MPSVQSPALPKTRQGSPWEVETKVYYMYTGIQVPQRPEDGMNPLVHGSRRLCCLLWVPGTKLGSSVRLFNVETSLKSLLMFSHDIVQAGLQLTM